MRSQGAKDITCSNFAGEKLIHIVKFMTVKAKIEKQDKIIPQIYSDYPNDKKYLDKIYS